MSVNRLKNIPGFSIDKVANDAEKQKNILRLENLDTDILPPVDAIKATKVELSNDDSNSYLPFIGIDELRKEVINHVSKLSGKQYGTIDQAVITAGGTAGMMNTLFAITDPGDEVIVTDPTYAGMIYRISLAGAIPKFVPYHYQNSGWRLDLDHLKASITNKTKAIFIMNPSMPSGAVLNHEEWHVIADLCKKHKIWLVYNAAMERILFDNHQYFHPASMADMENYVITIGSISKEYRMIGWRTGWVVGPKKIMQDIAKVCIYNVVSPVGISQKAAKVALQEPVHILKDAVIEWQNRRDLILRELSQFSICKPSGGWSMLWDVSPLGISADEASKICLEKCHIAATPMTHWGERNSKQYVRLVFSNEPCERLKTIRTQLMRAFDI